MYLPQVRGAGRRAQKQVVEFGGLNYTQNIRDGELAACRGLSSAMWPCLTTCPGREAAEDPIKGDDLFAWDELVTVDGTQLRYGGEAVGTLTPGRKQFAVVNSKLCIFPDKKYLELESRTMGGLDAALRMEPRAARFTEDRLEIARRGRLIESEAKFGYMLQDGVQWYRNIQIRPYREEELAWDPETGWTLPDMKQVWAAREGGAETGVKVVNVAEGDCLMIPKQSGGSPFDNDDDGFAAEYHPQGNYIYVTKTSIENSMFCIYYEQRRADKMVPDLTKTGLKAGDRVDITGCETQEDNNRESLEIKTVEKGVITFVLGDGERFAEAEEAGTVTVERAVPELDFICASNNRLFGCSGKDQTIYASALGDPTNWSVYAGLASDSYAVAVGSPGAFTGCCAYGSGVLFFKENAIYKLMGLYPEEYELISYQYPGVQAGCERSIQNINEALIYKGRDGIYAYTGGYPQKISGKLGAVDYDRAVAGSDGRGYLVSMRRAGTGAWETLRYDLETGLWMGEDDREKTAFATLSGTLYYLEDGTLYHRERADGQGGGSGYEAVFVPMNETVHGKKGYSKLLLRLELDPGAWADVDVSTDGGLFQTVWTAKGEDRPTLAIPIRPGRCDKFQVRLRGEGRFVLRSMVREFTVGSVV